MADDAAGSGTAQTAVFPLLEATSATASMLQTQERLPWN